MSWHYLQEGEEASWEETFLDGAPSALLRLMPMREEYSLRDNEMESCHASPSGMTSRPLMPCHGEDSVAGKREADEPDKNMWPDTIRVIREVRPKHLLLENVPGLLAQSHGYMHTILGQLAESGYDCRWDCIPASALGANHQRDRLWIVAHHNDAQLRVQPRGSGGESRQEEVLSSGNGSTPWGLTQPEFCRTHDGMAGRMDTDRLKALGNGQVPAVVRFAWRHLS